MTPAPPPARSQAGAPGSTPGAGTMAKPVDVTDAERAYWAEMEARNLRAFGPGEGT